MKNPIFLVTVWLVATFLPAAAQQVDSPSSRSSAVTIGAEQEADRLVSLSAEKIIEVLQDGVPVAEGERAMLHYFNGRNTLRREQWPGAGCDMLLVQGYTNEGTRNVDLRGYHQVWEGARPGDGWQRFWLFRSDRSDPLPPSDAMLEAALPDTTVSE